MASITIEDFKKIDLRVAKVLEVEEIAGADRLWKLTIDAGEGSKQIVAGIKKDYPRESLLGRSIVVVNNLEPSTIRGVVSAGMLLAAKSDGALSLLTVERPAAPGSAVG